MITKYPKTKKEHIKYHIILWQAVIDEIKKNGLINRALNEVIKKNCFENIFTAVVLPTCLAPLTMSGFLLFLFTHFSNSFIIVL